MTREEKEALIRRHVEAHNRHDAAAAVACFAPGVTNHGHAAGQAGMVQIYESLYTAFPDFHFAIEQLLVDGDWVTGMYRQTGTHLGVPALPVVGGLLHQAPPTGRRVSVRNVHLYRIADGLIVEHHAVRDDLGMMQQLGLLPSTVHPAGDISRPAS